MGARRGPNSKLRKEHPERVLICQFFVSIRTYLNTWHFNPPPLVKPQLNGGPARNAVNKKDIQRAYGPRCGGITRTLNGKRWLRGAVF